MKQLDYKKKETNIYKVEYVYKSYDLKGKEPFKINIIIPKLKLQYYFDLEYIKRTRNIILDDFKYFYKYVENNTGYNVIPFTFTELDSNYHIKYRSIEINNQLQNLLLCKDELSKMLAKEIIFKKLGL